MRTLILFSILFIPFILSGASDAVPPLERIISVRMKNVALRDALNEMASRGGFSFSYNPKVIDPEEKVTLEYAAKPVRYILNSIFEGRLAYKAHRDYVILLPAKGVETKPGKAVQKIRVGGYIWDSLTNKVLGDVSVYDVHSLKSAVSDKYGYFSLEYTSDVPALDLRISKEGYEQGLRHITASKFESVEILLRPRRQKMQPDTSYLRHNQLVQPLVLSKADNTSFDFLLNQDQKINRRNLTEAVFKEVQFSFVPTLSTNKLISGNVVNNYSINLISGYSLGSNKFEVAGFMNMDRYNVKGFQAGGFANIVGGTVKGGQFSGFMNMVGDSVVGAQASGFANLVKGPVKGFQSAGFMNTNKGNMDGFQAAGFMNFNYGEGKGFQAAGFLNLNTGNMQGFQAAGFINYTQKDSRGTVVAGFINISKNFKGTAAAGGYNLVFDNVQGAQFAGIFNIAGKEMNGFQAAGIFNYAKIMKRGVQLATFNIADSCGGVPIGFFSYVRQGYHKIEVSADEAGFVNVAFRTGVRKFHNIFMAGGGLIPGKEPLLSASYGIGTTGRLSKKLDVDLDIFTTQNSKAVIEDIPNVNKIYAGLDIHLTNKVSLAMGPVLNFYIYLPNKDAGPLGYSNSSYFYDGSFIGVTALKAWMGGKVGIRLL